MSSTAVQPQSPKKRSINFSNIILGATINMAEVTSLGQPLEVVKTTMAANRNLNFVNSMKYVWSRGGIVGFYQGLIPWAWIEASTKGAVLLFVSAESEYRFKLLGMGNFTSGILGGVLGGVTQSYLTMGFCTCMKTVEITRLKSASAGAPVQSSWNVFRSIYAKEGLRGIYKGVNAVAIRQMTNWGSRFGFSRLVEDWVRKATGKTKPEDRLNAWEKIGATAVGGGLSAWNQPIEVIRVEMQSKKEDPNRPKNLTVAKTFKYIMKTNGVKGLYRGVTPRIGLGIWQTVFMVGFGDMAKDFVAKMTGEAPTAKH
ncbi:hypothetical protein NCAS_0C00760 [Naumovozyma castellii]|uniref:Mitochondrial DNA replication protein YHM2 n=1 Tax=Naumovozyma castellii TaxID=27288 RepID=G0VC58_NAUCA|nr:hypothetical protein NCAS_0C00760 [Naumovozyma castellii CBS 4309]CCC69066.1 hypothetical protein NCAS_0C00760 [Naumovozyma castellii CBS 4309]